MSKKLSRKSLALLNSVREPSGSMIAASGPPDTAHREWFIWSGHTDPCISAGSDGHSIVCEWWSTISTRALVLTIGSDYCECLRVDEHGYVTAALLSQPIEFDEHWDWFHSDS